MTAVRFASWADQAAWRLRDSRRQVIDFARLAPHSFWARPSPLEGWTNKDVLAHLAGGNDQMLQSILRAVTSGEGLDPSVLRPDTDAENARGVAARRDWSVERLVEALGADGEETLTLLAALKETDRDVHPGGASWTMGDLLSAVRAEDHDIEHLAQLQQALASTEEQPHV